MVSYSLVHRFGLDRFMVRAAEVGFDGIILPDVPVEEASLTGEAAQASGLCSIGLVAPTTSATRREVIAQASKGFLYQIAVAGTTGERTSLPESLSEEVAQMRKLSGLPVCVGFGISTAKQVCEVCRISDGAIVGSAIVRRIADALEASLTTTELVDSVSDFVKSLLLPMGS